MDEELRSEGMVHKSTTVVEIANPSSRYSERFIPVGHYNGQNKGMGNAGEPDTGRNGLCCDDPENSPGLRTDLSRLSSAGTDRIREEIQRAAAVRKLNFPQNTTLKASEEEEMGKSTGVSGAGTAAEKLADTNTPPGELTRQWDSDFRTTPAPQSLCEDEESVRKAREEGRVDVVFPGSVTQEGCCRFVCELLKCVLYQRQQLPMTYEQMVFFQKQDASTQPEDAVARKPAKSSGGVNWRRGRRTLQELDDVLIHLEALFSLSRVPRVLFMLGGSVLLPAELYEINMEAVVVGGSDGSLRTSSCLRQLFRTLFVADLLSDVKSVRLMATTVMALGHRDCGVPWFKPKLDFKVPARVKRQVISLASRKSVSSTRDWDDYIWFQAPVTVKGFCK
ncbi:MAD2L1-binding protein [Electrophorus electricus]|uniref:MAD2L1 binding protein n=1 Tax=Electrophorus electricus TaxID=8005 RepID=A0AAY5EPT5_ELEEL|nr:MAD2L1-binding protein [Electrophorus electricus]